VIRVRWLLATLLLIGAAGVRAQTECGSALEFTADGAIARWEACAGRGSQTFAAHGERRLGLSVSVEGQVVDEEMTWRGHATQRREPTAREPTAPEQTRREGTPHREWRFSGAAAAHLLEVARAYREVGAGALEHAITVTNASTAPLRDVVLTLDPGGALPPDHSPTGALADFFYDVERTLAADAEGDWRRAELDREVDAFALVARHKTLVIDSAVKRPVVDEAEKIPAVGGTGERLGVGRAGTYSVVGSAGKPAVVVASQAIAARARDADEDASRASGRLLLRIAMPEIGAGESVVLRQRISVLPTHARVLAAAGYEGLTYAHLAAPIAWLSATVERALIALSSVAGPGLAVILLAISVRAATLPVSLWSARRQSEFAVAAERMKPEIASVRASYEGAEQSERILRIYKDNGVSPFSGLKGSFGLFLQIPFLLAVFNVTTLSSSLYAEPFLWIEDLSLADAAAPLPASIMLFGGDLNALPLALGMVFLLAPPAGSPRPAGFQLGPVLVTLLMVALVYSFASALLLYWLAANTFQAGERFAFRGAGLAGGGAS
jgi:YidC/Oxa1 family membrane protein insertase